MNKIRIILSILALFVGSLTFAQIDRSKIPDAQPAPEIKIDIPDVVQYDNGLKVIVVENHKLPVVSFQLFIDYPIIKEGDKAGMMDIFGQLLASGTSSYPKDEFDAKVDYMGADIFTNPRGFYASSLKKHTPKLLELLSEVVLSPTFPKDEFDRIVTQTKSGLATEKNDPGAMVNNVKSRVNYGDDHAYGDIVTEETIDNISLDDIKLHYDEHFKPNNAYLVIVGDVTPEEADAWVKKYFMKWQKGMDQEQENWEVPSYEGTNVFFIDKPGAVQSQISITHTVDLQPGHPDVIKLRLMNQILGGGSFSAHLMQNLREDKAYTYGCYSSIGSDPLKASFSAGGSFRNEVTDSAIVQIMYEIEWMTKNLVDDDELRLVKNSITGSFGRSLENPRTLANFALNMARYDLPKDYYTTYLTKLESITKEDILATAKKYLRPDNMQIIIAGNEEVIPTLEVFDTNGGMEFKDNYGNEKVRLKEVGEGVTAESILHNYTYKRFSTTKEDFNVVMAKIGYIETTYSGFVEAFGGDMVMTEYAGAPNKSATILKASMGGQEAVLQKEYFNGEKGGIYVAMGGFTPYAGDTLERKKLPSFPIEQYYYANDPKLNVKLLGIDEIDGKEYYKIKIQKEGADEFKFEYYSVDTGWLVMEETIATDEEGNTQTVTTKYENYEELKKGFMVPKKITLVTQGMTIESDFVSGKIGKKPKSKAFEGEF